MVMIVATLAILMVTVVFVAMLVRPHRRQTHHVDRLQAAVVASVPAFLLIRFASAFR